MQLPGMQQLSARSHQTCLVKIVKFGSKEGSSLRGALQRLQAIWQQSIQCRAVPNRARPWPTCPLLASIKLCTLPMNLI